LQSSINRLLKKFRDTVTVDRRQGSDRPRSAHMDENMHQVNNTGWLKKSKLLIFAVNEINTSQTRVSFAKFIPKLFEKMFNMYSIVPNYSFSILKFFIKILSSLLIQPIITI